ncbi:MAG: phosphoglycerate dehydrogenase [Actinobacteria bacterium]|nr:phosphoglycerate dehydrogenase [Actinomycetota bacterium]
MHKKILVTDGIAEDAKKILEAKYIVDLKKGLSPEELRKEIRDYNAIIIRSATKMTSDIIEYAENLEVIGRAGVGVDNVDVKSATKKGVVVVNAPGSNSNSVAEHALGLMFALARKIPEADYSTKAGKWEKSKFKGIEIEGKTLGIVGFGKIGYIVAKKAIGLGMKVTAYDPFTTDEKFSSLGIERANKLEDLYKVADFISIHLPKNKDTIDLFNKKEFAKMKKGVIIINSARGGIIVEKDLADAIREGQVGGAALDVFESEPCASSPLFELDRVVCTPHLGASTDEAQDRAGIMIAEQVSDVLEGKPATFAVNVPAVSSEAAEAISPFFELCDNIGGLFTGLFEGNLETIEIGYEGKIADYDTKILTNMILVKILGRYSPENVNIVNVGLIAEENGLKVKEIKSLKAKDYINLITLTGRGRESELSISGTVTGMKNRPRFVSIDKFAIDMVPSRYMAFVKYEDVPGQIGKIGTAFGKLNINIAAMHVGRKKISGEAVMGLNLDSEITDEMLKKFKKLSGFENIKVVNLV